MLWVWLNSLLASTTKTPTRGKPNATSTPSSKRQSGLTVRPCGFSQIGRARGWRGLGRDREGPLGCPAQQGDCRHVDGEPRRQADTGQHAVALAVASRLDAAFGADQLRASRSHLIPRARPVRR